MGFFSKSKEDKFKDKLVDFWNLLASLSYQEKSWNTHGYKVADLRHDLFYLAKEFNDPFAAYFKRYTSSTTILGEKTSIGEGIVIALLALDYATRGMRLSRNVEMMISNQARIECSTEAGRNKIREVIRDFHS